MKKKIRSLSGYASRQRYRNKPQRTLKDKQAAVELRSKVNQLPELLIEPMVTRSLTASSEQVQWTTDAKVKCDSLYRMSEVHALSLLSKIECPVVAVIGSEGYVHLKQKTHRYRHISNFESFKIEGGHHCHLEYPERVSHCIRVLVNKIKT